MGNPHIERGLVRLLIGAALVLALTTCALVPVPMATRGDPALPAIAFEQVGLYRLEVAVLVFYGVLLLVTPAFSGLIRGRLPTEISARGAKFADEIDRSAGLNNATLEKLEMSINEISEGLVEAMVEVDRLKKQSNRDKRQQGVASTR